MGVALLLQSSVLVAPLYLAEEPPELRALQRMVFTHAEAELAPPGVGIPRERALAGARAALEEVRGGAEFAEVAERVSHARGVELGSYARGMLPEPLDAFLFSAAVGDVSEPLDTPSGIEVLRRVEAWAGCLSIYVAGTGDEARAKARAVEERLAAGADFAGVAAELSDDRLAAEDGGRTMIYQRGARDRLVKAAVFDAAVGEWRGPIESPLGFHFVKRVAPAELPERLRERKCVRLRALLVAWKGSLPGEAHVERSPAEARERVELLARRLAEGADLADLARAHDDDPGGRARAGDLGWLHRNNPRLPDALLPVFSKPVGWTSPPLRTESAFVLLRRDA